LFVDILLSLRDVFTSCLVAFVQMAETGQDAVTKESLEFRRCIILAVVASTDVESESLKAVLETGYLSLVKTWMDQILSGAVGEWKRCRLQMIQKTAPFSKFVLPLFYQVV